MKRWYIYIGLCIAVLPLANCVNSTRIAAYNSMIDTPANELADKYSADSAEWTLTVDDMYMDVSSLAPGTYTYYVYVPQKRNDSIPIVTRYRIVNSGVSDYHYKTNYIIQKLKPLVKYDLVIYGDSISGFDYKIEPHMLME